jgi:hypothetical protein
MQQVIDSGFNIPKQGGLYMPLGHVRSKLDHEQIYYAIISQVAIGRAKKLKPE